MESKIMGFAGVESYDLIHYLSRTLNALGCTTACIDNSGDMSLAWSVPGGLSEGQIAYYQGADFGAGIDPAKLDKKYDYVLVYCGFSGDRITYPFEELYFVTDYQLHHLEAMKGFEPDPEAFRFLVVRERVSTKLKPDYVIEELSSFGFTPDTTFVLEDGPTDLETKVLCQHTDNFVFNKVSQGIRDFIIQVLGVDFNAKEIQAAFKTGSRRF